MADAVVVIESAFQPEAEVRLERRVGDWYSQTDPVDVVEADERGSVRFEGLEDGARFWVVGPHFDGRVGATAATSKVPATPKPAQSPEDAKALSQQRVNSGNQNPIMEGSRSSHDLKVRTAAQQAVAQAKENAIKPEAHEPTVTTGDPLTAAEGAGPANKQADVPDVPQSSATAMGAATPTPTTAPVRPAPAQAAAKDIPQKSATELGTAAPAVPAEEVGGEQRHARDRNASRLEEVEQPPASEQRLPADAQDATGTSIAALLELPIKELRARAKAAGQSAGGSKKDIVARLVPVPRDVSPGNSETDTGIAQDAAATAAAAENIEQVEEPADEEPAAGGDEEPSGD